jgi:hypothetical protein
MGCNIINIQYLKGSALAYTPPFNQCTPYRYRLVEVFSGCCQCLIAACQSDKFKQLCDAVTFPEEGKGQQPSNLAEAIASCTVGCWGCVSSSEGCKMVHLRSLIQLIRLECSLLVIHLAIPGSARFIRPSAQHLTPDHILHKLSGLQHTHVRQFKHSSFHAIWETAVAAIRIQHNDHQNIHLITEWLV